VKLAEATCNEKISGAMKELDEIVKNGGETFDEKAFELDIEKLFPQEPEIPETETEIPKFTEESLENDELEVIGEPTEFVTN